MGAIDGAGSWAQVIGRLLDKENISIDEARAATRAILLGEASSAQITAFIVALRAKGETVQELEGMLAEVRLAATSVVLPPEIVSRCIDIVGTGGDRSHSVNISTMASLVVAGAGVPVCKHGNRAFSSKCGTADVLEALGVVLELSGEGVAQCVVEAGMGFCFAPAFHPAFKHAGPSRREIGVPTAFNLLGPMANPAEIESMVVGVGDHSVAPLMAQVLATRGVTSAWVVHGHGGLDELSLSGPASVTQLRDGSFSNFEIDALEFGFARVEVVAIRGGDAQHNAQVVRDLLGGQRGAIRDIVVLNAAGALVVAGAADDMREAVAIAATSIDSGSAQKVLDALISVSRSVAI